MTSDQRIAAAIFFALGVSGCTATDPTFGNAVRQTMAAQVVNPDPDYQGEAQTTAGTQSVAAVERYRNGTVKKPDTIRTTEGTSGTSN